MSYTALPKNDPVRSAATLFLVILACSFLPSRGPAGVRYGPDSDAPRPTELFYIMVQTRAQIEKYSSKDERNVGIDSRMLLFNEIFLFAVRRRFGTDYR